MTQSWLQSLRESWTNVVIGFGINYAANLVVLPLFGYDVTPTRAFGIGIVFTAISMARSFLLRRLYERTGNQPLRWLMKEARERYLRCKARALSFLRFA